MVMGPVVGVGRQIRLDSIFLSGGMPPHLTAFADPLIGLDMGAGRNFLQEDLDWLRAGLAFEGKNTGWLGWHGT